MAPPKTGTSPVPQALPKPAPEQKPGPNEWLRPALSEPCIGHDWLVFLGYAKLAETLGESLESHLGPSACWVIPLSEVEDVEDSNFKGIFLTEKHGFGFLNQGHLARFNRGVAILGTRESALEGIGVDLVAVGLDAEQRVVFLVKDDYRTKFGAPDQAITEEQRILKHKGALVMSVWEALHSPDIIELIWTVPAKQENPDDPQVTEVRRAADEPATP